MKSKIWTLAWSRVANTVRAKSPVSSVAKNDSATALSNASPRRPTDRMTPASARVLPNARLVLPGLESFAVGGVRRNQHLHSRRSDPFMRRRLFRRASTSEDWKSRERGYLQDSQPPPNPTASMQSSGEGLRKPVHLPGRGAQARTGLQG